eukprot:COSAG01_NODE_20580_length_947_cov_1.034198_1_plen_92_part_00
MLGVFGAWGRDGLTRCADRAAAAHRASEAALSRWCAGLAGGMRTVRRCQSALLSSSVKLSRGTPRQNPSLDLAGWLQADLWSLSRAGRPLN